MKLLQIFALLFLTTLVTNAQIVLDKEFSPTKKKFCYLEEIEPGVFKYVEVINNANQVKVYNTDFTIYKTINIPVLDGYTLNGFGYLTSKLFDLDDKLEFFVDYYRNTPYDQITKIMNEDFVELISCNKSSIEILNIGNNTFKMSIDAWNEPYSYKSYSLPGVYPPLLTGSQTLSFSHDTLSLTNGGKVYLGDYKQKIYMSNDTIYLTNGGSVVPSALKNAVSNDAFGIGVAYPNPTASMLNIEYSLPNDERTGKISVLNANGLELMNSVLTSNSSSISLDLSSLSAGTYYLNLKTDKGYTSAKKVIVIK